MLDPLAMMQAANLRGQQRLQRGSGLLSMLQQPQGNMDPPQLMGSSNLPNPTGRFARPVDSTTITSPYGERKHPIKGKESFHTGEDFGAKQGQPVYAVADGVIRKAGNGGAYGNQLILDIGGGMAGMYGHLSRFNTKAGQRVKRGQIIGYVGSTGLSTGPHLHFEMWNNNKPINPSKYF